mmetsp:Transcript_41296/g.119601  ORF Transcript_41296/g.119601 Transcript_41296/m.119601 type:complete len:305 (+) Transcript_41296:1191-2105(+)
MVILRAHPDDDALVQRLLRLADGGDLGHAQVLPRLDVNLAPLEPRHQRLESVAHGRLDRGQAQHTPHGVLHIDALGSLQHVADRVRCLGRSDLRDDRALRLLRQRGHGYDAAHCVQVHLPLRPGLAQDDDLPGGVSTDVHQVVTLGRRPAAEAHPRAEIHIRELPLELLLDRVLVLLGQDHQLAVDAAVLHALQQLRNEEQAPARPAEDERVVVSHNPAPGLAPMLEQVPDGFDDETQEHQVVQETCDAEGHGHELVGVRLPGREAHLCARVEKHAPREPQARPPSRVVVAIAASGHPTKGAEG